ncbi:hypothetical protein ColTof4_05674 [Colletotrichum tofieldiae]|nr:hypothetical protein ColTof4_05674 [Colletotrichum tofieldiae]
MAPGTETDGMGWDPGQEEVGKTPSPAPPCAAMSATDHGFMEPVCLTLARRPESTLSFWEAGEVHSGPQRRARVLSRTMPLCPWRASSWVPGWRFSDEWAGSAGNGRPQRRSGKRELGPRWGGRVRRGPFGRLVADGQASPTVWKSRLRSGTAPGENPSETGQNGLMGWSVREDETAKIP